MEELVLRLVNQTQKPVFLTGRAGTGKTTMLRKIVKSTHKNYIIVAPTAVAAINAGGVTIHSMFQLPINPFLPLDHFPQQGGRTFFETRKTLRRHSRINQTKRKLFQNLELLVIDEVSMLRPDVLDAVDEVLRIHRKSTRPFGGVQVLFIGDLMQLPPIVNNQEWQIMKEHYDSKYFFDAQVLQNHKPVYIELQKIYRQADDTFISLLQKLRENKVDHEVLDTLESHLDRDFETKKNPGCIVLTTHNQQADSINRLALGELDGKTKQMKAEVVGDFPSSSFPLPEVLEIKLGAQVMFVKNDTSPARRYFNGKIGNISRIDYDEIYVRFEEDDTEIEVEKHTWENIKYIPATKDQEISEVVLGTYTQFPIRLAWAITVHKSQGLTFEKAAIDISKVFAPGQAYVALSRLTSLDGLKLLAPVGDRDISIEQALLQFTGAQKPVENVVSQIDHYSLQYLIDSARTALDYTDIHHWINDLRAPIHNPKPKSIWYVEKAWLEQRIAQMEAAMEVAHKFSVQLYKMRHKEKIDALHLHERLESGSAYFDEFWVNEEKQLLQKLADLSVVSRVRQYQKKIEELEQLVYRNIKRLRKLQKANTAIAQGQALDRDTVHSKRLAEQKIEWISALKANAGLELMSIEEVFEGSPSKKKKEKIPSSIISLKLWHEHKDIQKIAELRMLKKKTILGHLIKAVESGGLDIRELVDENRMQEVSDILGDQHYNSLSEMRAASDDVLEYDELRLYRIWKGQ